MNDKKKKDKFINKFSVALGTFFALFGFVTAGVVTHAQPYNAEYNSQICGLTAGGTFYNTNHHYDNIYYIFTDVIKYDTFQLSLPFNMWINGDWEDQTGFASVPLDIYIYPRSSAPPIINDHSSQAYAGTYNLDVQKGVSDTFISVLTGEFFLYDLQYFNNAGLCIQIYNPSPNTTIYIDTLEPAIGGDYLFNYKTSTLASDSYNNGYNAGYQQALETASLDIQQAYNNGYNAGLTAGAGSVDTSTYYNNGYEAGYGVGFTAGTESIDTQSYYDNGYRAGVTAGHSQSSQIAYNNGYQKGLKDANEHQVINAKSLIWNIASIPFETLKNVFNFEILGINVAGFVLGIITISFVIFLLKKFL